MSTLGHNDYSLSQPQPESFSPAGRGPLYVGFWKRGQALLIDGFLLSIATALLDRVGNAFSNVPAWVWMFTVISWAVTPAYYIWFFSTSGQTPGKKQAGIKVVSIDGTPLNWRKGVLRAVGYVLSDFSFFLGYLWSIWDEDKQAWHDKLAGTRVVPAAATVEQVQVAFNQMQVRPRSGAWKWWAAAAIGLQLALVGGVFLLVSLLAGMQPQLHYGEWDVFEKALMDRVQPDPRIPSFETHEDYGFGSGQPHDVWFHMEMTYDADCEMEGGPGDWCYELANELVKIVFDNYPHIDEINGIQVVMTQVTGAGPVSFEYNPVNDALTISEWRARLGIPAP